MTPPTAAALKTRYPAFAAVPDATVNYWINDGLRFVKEGWGADDYQAGLMAYAAHQMALTGLGTDAVAGAGVTSFRSGTFSATISDEQANATGYKATRYGQEFATIQRRGNGSARFIMTGVLR